LILKLLQKNGSAVFPYCTELTILVANSMLTHICSYVHMWVRIYVQILGDSVLYSLKNANLVF
jgi:hypothetical protein